MSNPNYVNFSITSQTGYSPIISAGLVEATSLVSSNLTSTSSSLSGYSQQNVAIGYTASNFGTAAVASINNLMNEPGKTAATDVNDPNLLHLPANCVINRVVVKSSVTVASAGAPTFTVGTKSSVLANALTNGLVTTPVVALMVLATVNAVNGGGTVGGPIVPTAFPAAATFGLNTAGQITTVATYASAVQGNFDNLVAIIVNTAALTAGSIVVEIYYNNAAY